MIKRTSRDAENTIVRAKKAPGGMASGKRILAGQKVDGSMFGNPMSDPAFREKYNAARQKREGMSRGGLFKVIGDRLKK